MAALCEPLAGLEVTDYEHRVLDWLTLEGTSVVAVVAALLWRSREAAPLGGADGESGTGGR